MKLCVVTCTYGRPHLLPRVIASFEAQDYQNKCMVILDDGGQYGYQEGDGWKLISLKERFKSLGAKRNYSLTLVPPDTYAVLPCDDDDFFLPWHLTAASVALQRADWSRPAQVLSPRVFGDQWLFTANLTGCRENQKLNRLYHPAWAMKLDVVRSLGGYPENLSGPEDQGLMRKMEEAGVTEADPINLGYLPSYVYCWGEQNISGMLNAQDRTGEKAWMRLQKSLEPVTLSKWSFPFDPRHPVIANGVRQRPF